MNKKYLVFCACGKDEWEEIYPSYEEACDHASFLEAEGVHTMLLPLSEDESTNE